MHYIVSCAREPNLLHTVFLLLLAVKFMSSNSLKIIAPEGSTLIHSTYLSILTVQFSLAYWELKAVVL